MNVIQPTPGSSTYQRRLGRINVAKVTMAHGGGGKAMRDLIEDVFITAFDNDTLSTMEDQARFRLSELAVHGDRLAMTTDSYVIHPLRFPGGDIGKLAVCGTINDLAVGGAKPLYLSCAVIIEEGLVVGRGACDKLFINTTGIGVIREGIELGVGRVRPGDAILVNGLLGDHGAAILNARGDMELSTPIESDCAALHGLIDTLLARAPGTRFLRDATRGGIATVLNEVAEASQVGILIHEERGSRRDQGD
jgi:hydrogenase expression/formation protein HypE